MSFNNFRGVVSAMPILALALAACSGADSPLAAPTTAPRPGGIPVYAGGPTSRDIVPTGKLDYFGDTAAPPLTRYRIEYHNGSFLSRTSIVYFIWYGNWRNNLTDQLLLSNLAAVIGSTPYLNIAKLYSNAAGQAPSSDIAFGGGSVDEYSHSATISDADVEAIVGGQVLAGNLPLDPDGIYFVMASPDIWESSGFVATYCAFHSTGIVVGSAFRYAFIGGPARSPQRCGQQGGPGPNGSPAGDAMASLFAAELFNIVTDPTFNGWYDKLGLEGADKCAWTFGTTHAVNGGRANVRFGQYDYLLQQLWVPSKNGGACGLTW
jgi:Phosphate-induced protein 1 conserved region